MIERLGFGCVGLTTLATPTQAIRLLETAFDLGVRHFDTAPIYGQGYSEKLVGAFLSSRRAQITVATKFGMRPPRPPSMPIGLAMGLNHLRRRLTARSPRPASTAEAPPRAPFVRVVERQQVQADFEASRRALGVDRVDLYLFHEGTPEMLTEEALTYLLDLRASGQVGQIGLAAGASSYAALRPQSLDQWDVLQYEAGPNWPQSVGLLQKHPRQRHVFHSCLKGVPRDGDPSAAGGILRAQLAANPKGLVLFSSTNIEHVRANLAAVSG